jgi:hypothetical protein
MLISANPPGDSTRCRVRKTQNRTAGVRRIVPCVMVTGSVSSSVNGEQVDIKRRMIHKEARALRAQPAVGELQK